ncbi:unnamed protein product [Soboliphyme baturini]|uniref:Uncharacterized protein n=1 Tax=Soboliphyme baturini TaxID=241478 RepID=A0A183J6L8_9BILA|nr:unnamed protein product [Soboliphyme baturini]
MLSKTLLRSKYQCISCVLRRTAVAVHQPTSSSKLLSKGEMKNTKTCSPVKLSYDLALLGAQVESTASRDYLSFDLQCVRDNL